MVRSLAWFREHVQTADGRPYDHFAYPHLGAPGGPCDAFDDHRVRNIVLQFASRLGKTFFGQCAQMMASDVAPGPMMFASESQKLAVEVVGRWYKMAERNPRVRNQLQPPSKRNQLLVRLRACQIVLAWARSVSTLADKPVRYGHANEVDKWEHESTSKEADPLKLFMDRGKEFPRRKFIVESTPTVKGRSRIERALLSSTNCRFYVPCPHCGKYQQLKLGNEGEPGGVVWDKSESGRSDRDLARKTGTYHCESCEQAILDHHRSRIMRRGVWCPDGCTVKDEAAAALFDERGEAHYEWSGWGGASWIEGEAVRDGVDAGYQLSSLYSLSLSWGDIAAEFVGCKDKPQELRNFVNQWKGETWEMLSRKQSWESLGERIVDKEIRESVVPKWGSLLTMGIDRQQDDRFPWCVDAWGPDGESATIAYGEAQSFGELQVIAARQYPHADGRASLPIAWGLFDSGYNPHGVYEFCLGMQRAGLNIWPSKGSSGGMNTDYRITTLDAKTSMPGISLVMIDPTRTQLWLEYQLNGEAVKYRLFNDSIANHQDFLEQLLNDAPVDGLDRHNNPTTSWDRINEAIPNDFRDCRRYSYVAMLLLTRGGKIMSRSYTPPKPQENESRMRQMRFRR